MIIKPDYNLKNIYEITPKMLMDMGVKAVFLDLDSTIMVSKSGKFLPETYKWFETLKKDFYIAIVTNNKNPEYTKLTKKAIPFKVVECANKPNPKKVKELIHLIAMKPEEVVMVGDRPLTDILVGKFAGTKTILVGSINGNENLPTKIVRALERSVIRHF